MSVNRVDGLVVSVRGCFASSAWAARRRRQGWKVKAGQGGG